MLGVTPLMNQQSSFIRAWHQIHIETVLGKTLWNCRKFTTQWVCDLPTRESREGYLAILGFDVATITVASSVCYSAGYIHRSVKKARLASSANIYSNPKNSIEQLKPWNHGGTSEHHPFNTCLFCQAGCNPGHIAVSHGEEEGYPKCLSFFLVSNIRTLKDPYPWRIHVCCMLYIW